MRLDDGVGEEGAAEVPDCAIETLCYLLPWLIKCSLQQHVMVSGTKPSGMRASLSNVVLLWQFANGMKCLDMNGEHS